MPYAHGVFTRTQNFQSDAANGVPISAPEMDGEFDGVAAGLSTCLLKDGTQAVIADIPMGGHRLTGLGQATAPGDAMPFGQTLTALVVLASAAALGVTFKPMNWAVGADTLGEWDAANSRWVAATAGAYLLTLSIGLFNSSTASQANLRFRKNGNDYDTGPGATVPANGTLLYSMTSVATMVPGEFIEVWANGVPTVNIVGGSGGTGAASASRFTVSRIY